MQNTQIDTVTVNGAKHALNDNAMIDSLFSSTGTCKGYAKIDRKKGKVAGIWFKDLQGGTYAYAKNGPNPFLVNCIKKGRKHWYSMGSSSITDKLVGLTSGYRANTEALIKTFESIA